MRVDGRIEHPFLLALFSLLLIPPEFTFLSPTLSSFSLPLFLSLLPPLFPFSSRFLPLFPLPSPLLRYQ